jgi:hypothetical protein
MRIEARIDDFVEMGSPLLGPIEGLTENRTREAMVKSFLKAVGGIVGCLILLLVIIRVTGLAPTGRTPGLWLRGNLVTTPVSDWSFADKYRTLEIQTYGLYWLPHSVTTYYVTYNGQLCVDSFYRAGIQYPHGRSWNENVARNPHVRIKIGNQLYECTLVHITDPAQTAAVLAAKTKKVPRPEGPPKWDGADISSRRRLGSRQPSFAIIGVMQLYRGIFRRGRFTTVVLGNKAGRTRGVLIAPVFRDVALENAENMVVSNNMFATIGLLLQSFGGSAQNSHGLSAIRD